MSILWYLIDMLICLILLIPFLHCPDLDSVVCSVLRCKVYDVPGDVPDSEAVRIFVVFQDPTGAKKAITVSIKHKNAQHHLNIR